MELSIVKEAIVTATENKDDKAADNSSQAPVEYETADGFMASFLLFNCFSRLYS